MKRVTLLALAAGILLFVALLSHYGMVQLLAAVAAAGWGLFWVAIYRFVTIATDAVGWRVLFTGPARPAFGPLWRVRWIGESINSLLPVAQVGGDVARARLAAQLGVPGPEAGATVVVDFTLGLVTQILYTLIGVALMAQASGARAETRGWLLGSLVAGLAVAAFYLAQRFALFQKIGGVLHVLLRGRVWDSLAGDAHEMDRDIAAIYWHRRSVIACGAWRMATWLLHTGETWLALYYLGAPVSLAHALILESLGTAVRSAAFAIPGGLGVQEGGFVLLGSQLGLSPQVSLALALVKRVRELLVGGPGLVAWTVAEGRNLARLLAPRTRREAKNDRG